MKLREVGIVQNMSCLKMSNTILMIKKILLGLFFIFLANSILAEEIELLHADEWLLPKQAVTILEMPAISKSMQQLQKNMNSSLLLKYPGGDEGTLWVNELRSWLIALGLSSKRIELVQGSVNPATIEFEILTDKLNINSTVANKELL